jgi:hypothetical protein
MSTTTVTKTTGRKPKTTKSSDEAPEHTEPQLTNNDWKREPKTEQTNNNGNGNGNVNTNPYDNAPDNEHQRRPSVMAFDRNEVATYENKKVSDLSISDLLKVLVRRGEVQENITVRRDCGFLMKKLNGERVFNNNRGYRGGRGDYNGRGGGYNGRGGYRGGSSREDDNHTNHTNHTNNDD